MLIGHCDIDVVIPSYRVPEAFMLKLYHLPRPRDCRVCFYMVADGPNLALPAALQQLAAVADDFKLLVMDKNLGYSGARNAGIAAGNAPYVLLLDDDIDPSEALLSAYHLAMVQYPAAFAYAGVVMMPPSYNAVTSALRILGVATHFEKPATADWVAWTPTANVMIARSCWMAHPFDEQLVYGGEDIAFFSRLSTTSGKWLRCVADARVVHPWWQHGRPQYGRLFRYGRATTDVICLHHVRPYTRLDFPNLAEMSVLTLLTAPLLVAGGHHWWPVWLLTSFGAADLVTAGVMAALKKCFNPLVAVQIWVHQFCHQFGALWQCLSTWGRLYAVMRRLDASFEKPFSSAFRLNRYKLIRGVLFLIGIGLVIAISTG